MGAPKEEVMQMRSIRPVLFLLVSAALIFAGGMLTGRLRAQQSGASPYYVITFVDLIPPNKDAGVALLKQYVDATRKEPGNQTALALTQISRPNHLFLYEVWQNEDAFNKHESNAATRDFRTKIQPGLGAPFDQRAHSKLE
jgi:quinol monooxygenase YgiN